LLEEFGEAFFDSGEGAFEDIGVLLAEGVEVEAFEAGEVFAFEEVGAGAEAAAGGAGVIESDFDFGVFGVDAEAGAGGVAAGGAGGVEGGAMGAPLGEGVEAEVMGDWDDAGHFRGLEGGGVDVDFLAKLFMGEECLVQAAGAAAVQVLADEGEGGEHGEALQSKENATAGLFLDVGEFFEIFAQEPEVHDEGGGGDLGGVEGGHLEGFWSTRLRGKATREKNSLDAGCLRRSG